MNNPFYRPRTYLSWTMMVAFLAISVGAAMAQSDITYDLQKPKAFENRKLRSELTPDKKMNPVKRLKENIVAQYNFYFNANNKLEESIRAVRSSYKDNFNALLPYYDMPLESFKGQQQNLDSVVIKCNNGILLHDLRNDWVDDLYLLMGKSYFYQQKFDSAFDVFQYINYTFQPKSKNEKGFEKQIGSNLSETGTPFNIATREKGEGARLSSRNDALLWIIRTQFAVGSDDVARSLIAVLRRDTYFPKRLKDELADLTAYGFYRSGQYDSAAHMMESSMGVSKDNRERSRRLFLIAQLYASVNKKKEAEEFFDKSITLTTDPIMEAYARIYQVGLSSDEADLNKRIDENVELLLQMIKKEKYRSYRSIIYEAAATMELERKQTAKAIELLIASTQFDGIEPTAKTKTQLRIAELAFDSKNYKIAKNYFDSVGNGQLSEAVASKKTIAAELMLYFDLLDKEDSLQRIARLPEKEREEFLRQLLRKLKKEQGIQEEEVQSTGRGAVQQRTSILDPNSGNIFSNDPKKGEWYFNNPTLVAQGKLTFTNKWGNRPNVDNWRRLSAISGNARAGAVRGDGRRGGAAPPPTDAGTPELSIEGLSKNLPLSESQMAISQRKKGEAYVKLAAIYRDKLGDEATAKDWIARFIREGNDTALLAVAAPKKDSDEKRTAINNTYQQIYDLFLSGRFEQALQEKKKADEQYGTTQWSPQLLYIESVYYIKSRKDEQAIAALKTIVAQHPESPLAARASVLAEVVAKRDSIESALTAMEVVRQQEDSLVWVDDRPLPKPKEAIAKQEPANRIVSQQKEIKKVAVDSAAFKVPVNTIKAERFAFNANDPYAVLLLMKDVDIVYINEAKRALARYNEERYPGNTFSIRNDVIGTTAYILMSFFNNAADALVYIERAAPLAPREIFPWLQADKYAFYIVSPDNLKKMMEDKETAGYIKFLQQQLPGKF